MVGVFTKYHVEVTYLRRQNISGLAFRAFAYGAWYPKRIFFVRLTDAKPPSILNAYVLKSVFQSRPSRGIIAEGRYHRQNFHHDSLADVFVGNIDTILISLVR